MSQKTSSKSDHNRDLEALRKSEERHRLLLNTLMHGVQENDCNGVITYSNKAHHQILGFEYGELVGKKIWNLQPSATDQESLRNYLAHLVKEQPYPVPYLTANRRKDGEIVDLQIDWNYVRGADGSLKGFISVITDVTESKKAEEFLQLRSQGLAALLEVSRSFVAKLDLQSVLQSTVDGVTKLSGLDTAAVYLLEGGMLHLWATTPPLPPDFPDELRIAPIADHPHILKTLHSNSPVLLSDMASADLTPSEQSVVKQRNLRTVLFLPLIAREKPVGTLIVGSVGKPCPIPDAEVDLCRTLANLAALAVENARLFKAGQQRTLELEQSLADRRRTEEEREKLQAQLFQAQKLESVGRLAGGVAHDFNNMLNVILGHADLALMRVNQSGPIYADLLEIRTAAERSADLTRQLLSFARKQTVAPRVLNLNETVAGTLKMVRRLIGEDISLMWLPDSRVWPVKIDPVQIDQILVNLCVNARDSIEGTGKITVETGNVAFNDADCADHPDFAAGEYVLLAVSDSGCGMDNNTLSNLFEPYFTTKEMGRGTGLGLATVYGIVKQNCGFIDIDSEPGKGSTFKIYLPRHMDKAEQTSATRKAKPVKRGQETVLLVEDEPALLNLGKLMLEMQGYKVLSAATPGEAIRLAEEHAGDIHLLMTDVVMPEMNGRKLAKNILSLYPGLRSLFMSGYTADIIAHHGALDKGIHFIQKPFTIQDLAAKVREILDHREDEIDE